MSLACSPENREFGVLAESPSVKSPTGEFLAGVATVSYGGEPWAVAIAAFGMWISD